MMIRAFTSAAFVRHVFLVVIISAKEKMKWVTAKAIVANMADKIIARIDMVMKKISHSMCEPLVSVRNNYAVAVVVYSATPIPALFPLPDFIVESVVNTSPIAIKKSECNYQRSKRSELHLDSILQEGTICNI